MSVGSNDSRGGMRLERSRGRWNGQLCDSRPIRSGVRSILSSSRMDTVNYRSCTVVDRVNGGQLDTVWSWVVMIIILKRQSENQKLGSSNTAAKLWLVGLARRLASQSLGPIKGDDPFCSRYLAVSLTGWASSHIQVAVSSFKDRALNQQWVSLDWVWM